MSQPQRRIGATDISAIVGLNPYANARDVYERIVNRTDRKKNKAMERGLKVEPLIRQAGLERYGWTLEPHPGIIVHPEYNWATASPDDWVVYEGRRCVIDYKSVSVWAVKAKPDAWGDSETDHCPEHYQIQMHWNGFVGGFERSLLLAAFGEDERESGDFRITEYRLYRLWREPAIEQALFRAGLKFWTEHIEAHAPPAMEPMETIKKRIAKEKAKQRRAENE